MNIKLNKLNLRSGESISISDGLTAIVGPNNAGKSALIREFHQRLTSEPGAAMGVPHKVFDTYEINFQGTLDSLTSWFDQNHIRREQGQHPQGYMSEVSYLGLNGQVLPHSYIQRVWNSQNGLGVMGSFYVLYLGADGRLGMVGNSGSYDPIMQQPTNSIQRMFADRSLENKISDLMEQAFGDPLTVSRIGGSQITLHVGKTKLEPSLPATKEYLAEITSLPFLQDQGDGVRAFIGILLAIATSPYGLIIIDEPEAFLHPPQAYLLGQLLAQQHDIGAQILVATHSSDIVAGITSVKAAGNAVSIVRLTRKGSVNHVAQIEPAVVGELYKDPLIKYYSVLDGLFSKGVVLCEGDSDCTYYRAVLESPREGEETAVPASTGIHFTHCGGKARMARAVDALRSAKVPVVSVVDIDFLQNDNEFNSLVAAHGGDPAPYQARRNVVKNSVDAWATKVKRSIAKTELNGVLDGKSTTDLSARETEKIRECVTPKSGWREFKKHGSGNLSGEAVGAFESLDTELRGLGIFMVRVGELERFHREVPADNKAEWLRRVLEGEKYRESSDARDFMNAVVAAISEMQ